MLHSLALHLREGSPEVRLMAMLGAQSGLRIEEVAGFTLDALNQAAPRDGSRTHYEITIGPANGVPTKYNKTRTIEITAPLLHELQRYAIAERRMKRLDKLTILVDKHSELFLIKDRP